MKNTDSILSPAQKAALILALTEHVKTECSTVDMEQRFRDTIDELYSFDSIGGPFSGMSPSRVLEEMDPIAFRCGVSDSSDSENVYEIDGDYYDVDKVDEARESFVAGLQTELDDAEKELAAEENDDSPTNVFACRAEVARLEAQIEIVESHAF